MGVGAMASTASGGAIRAGRAFVEVFADTGRLRSGLTGAAALVKQFGDRINSLGKIGIGAGLSGLVGGIAAFGKLQETAKLGDVADAFGLSAEKASRLFGIMQAGGSDLRDATEGVATFNQRIQDALEGKGAEAAEIFSKLGVGADQFTGDSADKFSQLLEVLKALPDPALRVQLLLRAVGEDTGKNLIPLLSMSSDELRKLGDSFVVSSKDMELARKTNRDYTIAVAQISAAWRSVAIALAPAVRQIIEAVTPYVKSLRGIIDRNRELVPQFVGLSAAILGVGVALVALSKALSVVSMIGSLVSFGAAAVKVLFSLGVGAFFFIGKLAILFPLIAGIVAILPALISAVSALGLSFGKTLGNSVVDSANILKNTFFSIGGTVKEVFEGVVAAFRSGKIELAFEIVSIGVQIIWKKMLRGLSLAIAKFVEDNRAVLMTLAGLSAAWTGMRWGRIGGGWGMVAGGVAGLAVGVAGADEMVDWLVKSLRGVEGDTAKLERALAAKIGEAKVARAPDDAAPVDELAAMKARHPELFTLAKDIRAGFQMQGLSAQRFGFGNDLEKETVKNLRDIRDGKGALPMKIGAAVADGLVMK